MTIGWIGFDPAQWRYVTDSTLYPGRDVGRDYLEASPIREARASADSGEIMDVSVSSQPGGSLIDQ